MIDPVTLRILVAVHDTGSVTGAARLLGYTGPNITQHLRKLERHLSAPMVEKAGRSIRLTPIALSLVEHARGIVDDLEQLPQIVSTASAPSGRMRVAAFPTALRGLLLPAIAGLRKEVPALTVTPHELEPDRALEGLALGRVDAVITKTWGTGITGPVPTRALHKIILGTDPLEAILPATHRLARRRRIRLSDLADDQWTITPSEDPYGTWIASHSPTLLDPLRSAFQAAEFQSLIRAVELGLAVTVIPRMGRGDLPAGVVAVPLVDDDAFRTVELYVRPVLAHAPNTRALAQELTRHLPET